MGSDLNIVITGVAGFIGSALAQKFLKEDYSVTGIDNLNSYYDINLKKSRLKIISNLARSNKKKWSFFESSIEDFNSLKNIFIKIKGKIILINLAAQAGVRYSIENPTSYIQSNLVGFANILEITRKFSIYNLIYASSSSVYGINTNYPYCEKDSANHPMSLYAATKKSNELMAHSYSNLYNIKATGLRFFTVYGPWGRPDMAPMLFANAILKQKPINIFNNGFMKRDFTYIDDIVESTYRCSLKQAKINNNFNCIDPDPSTSLAPHMILNIGGGQPIDLIYFINLLEEALKTKAIKNFLPMQQGDVKNTSANTELLEKWINYKPKVSIEKGVIYFANWYKNYFKNS